MIKMRGHCPLIYYVHLNLFVMDNLSLIESFSEFKDEKFIDRVTLMSILEEVFRNTLKRKFGDDDNFDVIINPDKGDLEIWRNRVVVNDGELAIGVTLEDAVLRFIQGGGPVQIVYPSDGTAFHADAMALVAGAPNEGNGKAFLDFMMSADAQTIVAEQGRRPVRGDVASNPALLPVSDIVRVNYNNAWAAENRKRIVSAWEDMLLDVQ